MLSLFGLICYTKCPLVPKIPFPLFNSVFEVVVHRLRRPIVGKVAYRPKYVPLSTDIMGHYPRRDTHGTKGHSGSTRDLAIPRYQQNPHVQQQ